MGYFRETGRPIASRVVSATAAGTVLAGNNEEKVIVYDVLSSVATTLTDGTDTVMHVPAGICNLSSPISFGVGNGVVLGGNADITITYSIQRGLSNVVSI